MVAAAKLRRAQERIERARPTREACIELLARAVAALRRTDARTRCSQRARGAARSRSSSSTGDRGLCGALQHQHHPKAVERFAANERPGRRASALASSAARASSTSRRRRIDARRASTRRHRRRPRSRTRRTIAEPRHRATSLSGEVDRVYLVYNQFTSRHRADVARSMQLLPIAREARSPTAPTSADRSSTTSTSRDAEEILDGLLPRYVEIADLPRAARVAAPASTGARMTAMDTATENAERDDRRRSRCATTARARQRSPRRSWRSSAAPKR